MTPWRQLPVLLALVSLLPTAPGAFADDLATLVFFGDSLSDPGNHFIAFGQISRPPFVPIPDAPYAIGGHHFSNGRTWAENLAEDLGRKAAGEPALRAPGVFTNYAVGRARARAAAPVFPVYDLSSQVGLFLSHFGGLASPDDLYVVWIGANDLEDALVALLIDDPSGAMSVGIIQAAIAAVADNIRALWIAGARTFLIPSVPNLGVAPAVRALGPEAEFAATLLTEKIYNPALDQALNALAALPTIRFVRLDVSELLREVVAAPRAFGLTNVSEPCLTFFVTRDPVCEAPNRYLFWDGVHPTKAAHRIIADAARLRLGRRPLPFRPRCREDSDGRFRIDRPRALDDDGALDDDARKVTGGPRCQAQRAGVGSE